MTEQAAIEWFVELRDSRSALTKAMPQEVRVALVALKLSDWESLGYSQHDAGNLMESLKNVDDKTFSRIVGVPVEFKQT